MVVTSQKNGFELTEEAIKNLAAAGIIPNGTPPAQVAIFAQVCADKKLSPFSKHIYLMPANTKQGTKYVIVTGVDGFRLLATRSGAYAGSDDPRFNVQSDGSFKTLNEIMQSGRPAETCTVTVYRIVQGYRAAFTATVAMKEFNKNTPLWLSAPNHMLAIKAENHAIKKGFSEETAGVHSEDDAQFIAEGETSINVLKKAQPKVEKKPIEVTAADTVEENAPALVTEEVAAKYADLNELVANIDTLDDLRDLWVKNHVAGQWDKDDVIKTIINRRKAQITANNE